MFTKSKQQQCTNEHKRNAMLRKRNREHKGITKECDALGEHEQRYKEWQKAVGGHPPGSRPKRSGKGQMGGMADDEF